MINVAELLKDAPEGTELWFTLYGKVKFMSVNFYETYPIQVRLDDTTVEKLDKYGRYYDHFEDGECVLFPSKDCRTWEGWKVPLEPKFKVGDWIVNDYCFGKVIEITNDAYLLDTGQGIPFSCEHNAHLWTIQDARNGDVITNGKLIVIFNKLEEPAYRQHIIAYVGLDLCGRLQITEDTWRLGVDKAIPATKEQRDLLFAKMKEAGYQWDVDKKELRKIQPHYDISNFKPFDKVLVRHNSTDKWKCGLFSHLCPGRGAKFMCVGALYSQCIPFNDGTKHLLGATDMCPEEYINW